MSDEERGAFIAYIAENPEAGDIMVGTGGVRKVRWGVGSRGKSGGVRVIYYYHNLQFPLFLLTVFTKNERENISQSEKNELKRLIPILIEEYEVRRKVWAKQERALSPVWRMLLLTSKVIPHGDGSIPYACLRMSMLKLSGNASGWRKRLLPNALVFKSALFAIGNKGVDILKPLPVRSWPSSRESQRPSIVH
jgi:RelE toxin of RelE / RelB toxin-antitoxin system